LPPALTPTTPAPRIPTTSEARRRSDSDRISPIVASIKGRAKWGLQAISRRRAALLKEVRGVAVVVVVVGGRGREVEGVVVGDEEVVEAEVCEEVVSVVVVVRVDRVVVEVVEVDGVSRLQMSEVQSEAVCDGEDVVEEALLLRLVVGGGRSIAVVVSEIRLSRSTSAFQGRCAADGHCRSHNTAAECCVASGARALEAVVLDSVVSDTGRIEGEREAGLTVCGWLNGAESPDGKRGWEKVTWRGEVVACVFGER
jgi:hypothetical protein